MPAASPFEIRYGLGLYSMAKTRDTNGYRIWAVNLISSPLQEYHKVGQYQNTTIPPHPLFRREVEERGRFRKRKEML